MYEEIGAYDAKTKLPEILRRVERGETFTITNRGRAIANLVPSTGSDRVLAKTAVGNLLKIKKITMTNADLQTLKQRGRK